MQQNKNLLKVVHQHENQLRNVHNEVGFINTKVDCTKGPPNDNIHSSISGLQSMIVELTDHAKKGEMRLSNLENILASKGVQFGGSSLIQRSCDQHVID